VRRCESVGMKTRFMYLEVATWWRVGIKSGCRGGGGGGGGEKACSRCGSRVSSCASGQAFGEVCWMVLRREERKVERDWQMMSVVG
jgi:hypothetical protein